MSNPIVKWSNYKSTTVLAGTSMTVGTTNAVGVNGSISVGDLIIVMVTVMMNGGGDPGTISGSAALSSFTTVFDSYSVVSASDFRTYVGYKVATAGEPGTYLVSWSLTSVGAQWAILDISPVNTLTPIDDSGGAQGPNGSNMAAPSVSPVSASDLLINIFTDPNGNVGNIIVPNTSVINPTAGGGFNQPKISVSSLNLAASGPTGTQTATITGPIPSINVSMAIAAPNVLATTLNAQIWM